LLRGAAATDRATRAGGIGHGTISITLERTLLGSLLRHLRLLALGLRLRLLAL